MSTVPAPPPVPTGPPARPLADAAPAGAVGDALPLTAPGYLPPSGVELAFVLVGLVTLGAAVLTVTSRQLVHAALWLVLTLGGLAAAYLLLTAEFLAWVQVLIYVGSVVVLLLFGLMLTRAPIGPSPHADSGNRPVALAVAGCTAALLVTVVVDALRGEWIDLSPEGGAPHGTARKVGESVFRHWVLPFEALSVLLLAALVGAVVLARRRRAADRPTAAPAPGRRTGGRDAGDRPEDSSGEGPPDDGPDRSVEGHGSRRKDD